MTQLTLSLDPAPNRAGAINSFTTTGRAHVPSILTDASAKNLHTAITDLEHWNAIFDRDGQNVDLNDSALSILTDVQKTALLGHLSQTAATGFQYFFANIPLYDAYHSGREIDPRLTAIYEFINGEAFLNQCRALTGMNGITFADAQLTRYGPGQFLTRHNDDVDGKNRLAAYVLNLTPDWRTEWGGTLEFYDAAGNVVQGFTPTFNALNLFRVPQSHAVTYVTPFAQGYRYAITGWLRSGTDPKG